MHSSYLGKRIHRGLFKSKNGNVLNADVNGSLNILRLGTKKNAAASNMIFNPTKVKRIDELNDVACFK